MKTNRRKFLLGGAAVAGHATLFTPSLLLAQPREFRLGLITPPGHPWNNAAIRAGERLSNETDGRLSVTVFHAGQLGNEAAMLQQLQSGALDMAWLQAAELGSRVAQIASINAPYLVRSTAKIPALVRHPEAMKMFDLLPAETGTIGLGWGITGMRYVFSVGDISSLQDLNGMKLRINPTPAYRDFYQLLGAAPTPIPTPQVFDAMSNRQVDGLEADLDFSWNQRFDQVSNSMLQMNALFMPMIALVSGRVWQSLPEADREVIGQAVTASLDEQIQVVVDNEPEILSNFEETGIPIRTVDEADTEPVIEAYDAMWIERAPNLPALRAAAAEL